MGSFYDEIEIEDFEYDSEEEIYYYPCPCGDRFQITKEELKSGQETATCPSCSLIIKIIYDKKDYQNDSLTCGDQKEEEEEKILNSIKALEVN